MTFLELEQEFAMATKELQENQAAFSKIDNTKIDIRTQMKLAVVFQRYEMATIELNNIIKELILQDAIRKGLTLNE